MYNSVAVSLCMKVVRAFHKWYGDSMVYRTVSHFRGVATCWKNSATKRWLTRRKPLFQGSFFCRIFYGIFSVISWICGKLYELLRSPIHHSLIFGGLDEMLTNFNALCAFLSLLFLYTGVFTFPAALFVHHGWKLSLGLIVTGIVGSLFQGKYDLVLQQSKILDFFLDFFRLDRKEEDQWW